MAKRTMKRSRSGADAPCPECGKKLRGLKGLNSHRQQAHGIARQVGRKLQQARG